MSESVKQAIAGVAPSQLSEVTVMTVWPTMGSLLPGRWLGMLYDRKVTTGLGNVLSLRNLLILITIPGALKLFAWLIAPIRCRRYRLTNRRVVIQRGYLAKDVMSVGLDQFDSIETEVLPGQAWFRCGDLVFKRGGIEVFRLAGVSRPETFRHTCLKAHMSYVGVQAATKR